VQAVSSLQDSVTTSQKEVDIHPVLNTTTEDGPIERYEQDEGLVAEKEVTVQQPILQKEAKVAQKVVERPLVQQSTVTLDIGARRKKILEVVRSKGQATIHEFIESIQGCSSKTIQRELTSLVLSGTLKKTGERRWSKYSLR
jgi:predicted HTH transcriptional regulator